MKNTKKVLSVALAGALAFGSVGAAFAADAKLTEGIDNQDVVKAIEKLNAFDIVNGMEDGNYHAEGELTRAQFSKMLVEALGLGSAAQNSTQKPAFNDVDESAKWAWGYINVAQGQGLLSGYPDGTFKPSAKVSYAEALTMLVRALGYKDEFLSGSWPGNYMAKAADVDVTDGVTVDGSSVNRGAAALLLSNTLDANIIKQETFGDDDNWVVNEDKTLIEDKLDVEKYEDAQVIATPKVDSGIDKDQITFHYDDGSKDGKDKTVDVDTDRVNIDNLLGEGLNIYYDADDKEIVYVEKADKEFKTYYDVVDKDEDIKDDEFTIIKADKELSVDEDLVKYYIDNKEVDFDDFKKAAEKGDLFVKAVADEKGNITVVDAQEFEINPNGLVVVESDKDQLTYFDNSDSTKEIKVKDYDKVVVMDNKGNIMNFEDLKANDVVYVNNKNEDGDLELASSKDEVLQLVVVRDAVKGKAESYKSDSIEIDNKDYDATAGSTVSLNEEKDVFKFISTDGKKKLEDMTDEKAEVTALLDLNGDVRHVTTNIKSSSDDLFGIISGVDTKYDDTTLKILNQEGKEVEYELDLETDGLTGTTEAHLASSDAKYDVVKFTVDKDGEIDTLSLLAEVDQDKTATAKGDGVIGTLDNEDVKKDAIKIGGSYVSVNDDVIALDYTEAYSGSNIDDVSDAEIIKWADLVDDKPGTGADAIYVLDDNDAIEFIVFTKDFNAGSDDYFAGYVVDARNSSDDDYVDMVVEGTSEVVRYEVNSGTAQDETAIIFNKKADGTIDIVGNEDSYESITGTVTEIDGNYVKLKKSDSSIVSVKLASDAVYYEEDDVRSYSDVDVDDVLTVIADANLAKVVKITDAEDVTEDTGNTEETTGVITYVNSGETAFAVDNSDPYTVGDNTVLKDKDGKVVAIGQADIANDTKGNLLEGDQVEVKAADGVATEIKRLKTKAELDAAAEQKVVDAELAKVKAAYAVPFGTADNTTAKAAAAQTLVAADVDSAEVTVAVAYADSKYTATLTSKDIGAVTAKKVVEVTIAEASTDASVKSVKVKGLAATVDSSDDKVYNIEMANGTDLDVDLAPADIVVELTDSNATKVAAVKSDAGATWTVVVTAEDGTTSVTYTVKVTVAS